MSKYYTKEVFNDEIQTSIFRVYKRRFFGLLSPKIIDYFFYESQAKDCIKQLTTPKRDK